jgi:hypothetical protein
LRFYDANLSYNKVKVDIDFRIGHWYEEFSR